MQYKTRATTLAGRKTTNFKTHWAFFVFSQFFLFLGKPGSLELPVSFYLNFL